MASALLNFLLGRLFGGLPCGWPRGTALQRWRSALFAKLAFVTMANLFISFRGNGFFLFPCDFFFTFALSAKPVTLTLYLTCNLVFLII